MKKTMIALMSLFMLVACSEDAYQEADKMSENGNVENTEPQNSVRTVDPNTGYTSPYEWVNVGSGIHYVISNDIDPSYNITMDVTPIIGLAYYDGVDDGKYDTPLGVYDLDNGNYPNLYNNQKEYLNLVEAAPLLNYTGNTSSSMPGLHCPTLPGVLPTYFDVSASATPEEADLLSVAGKVYYYKVTVSDASGVIGIFYSKAKFEKDSIITPTTNYYSWNYMGPLTTYVDNFYYDNSTQEIIVGNTTGGALARNYIYSVPNNLNFALTMYSDSSQVVLMLHP